VRIQVLVTNNVYPPTFGLPMRVFHLARALAHGAQVRVTCAVKSRDSAARREHVDGVDIARVKTYHPTLFYYLQRARLVPDYFADWVYRVWSKPLTDACDDQADVWQIESLGLASLIDRAPRGALKVYASQNVEAEWFERVGEPVLGRGFWTRRVESLERSLTEKADLVLAVSEEDRESFVRRYGIANEKVSVVDNGFDGEAFHPPTPSEREWARASLGIGSERCFLFVGSDFPHNRMAVEELFRHVVPKLESLQAVLILAGSVSGAYGLRAANEGRGRVRCLGMVPDLRPALWASDVGLNPMTAGAGSNGKLPTYLGAGLPVVSTPFGLRGFQRLARFTRQSPVEDFATALAQPIVLDPGVGDALASYSWQAIGERLAELYRHRLASAGVRSCAS
jgi:glycosyltransferase involved in cell wall biosynthesis